MLVGSWLCYRAISGHSLPYEILGVNTSADRDRPESDISTDSVTVAESITIGKPARDLSEYVRDAENLDRIMGDTVDVTSVGENRHRWSAQGPLGRRLSWETRIVEERPGEILRWESIDGATLSSDGSISFRPAPGDRGTRVTLRIRFDPPGGTLGSATLERLSIVPDTLASTALDRFKSLVEAGEVPTLEGNPSARGTGGR